MSSPHMLRMLFFSGTWCIVHDDFIATCWPGLLCFALLLSGRTYFGTWSLCGQNEWGQSLWWKPSDCQTCDSAELKKGRRWTHLTLWSKATVLDWKLKLPPCFWQHVKRLFPSRSMEIASIRWAARLLGTPDGLERCRINRLVVWTASLYTDRCFCSVWSVVSHRRFGRRVSTSHLWSLRSLPGPCDGRAR